MAAVVLDAWFGDLTPIPDGRLALGPPRRFTFAWPEQDQGGRRTLVLTEEAGRVDGRLVFDHPAGGLTTPSASWSKRQPARGRSTCRSQRPSSMTIHAQPQPEGDANG